MMTVIGWETQGPGATRCRTSAGSQSWMGRGTGKAEGWEKERHACFLVAGRCCAVVGSCPLVWL